MDLGLINKEFVGLAYQDGRIYSARIKKVKGVYELVSVDSMRLSRPLDEPVKEGVFGEEAEEQNIFGIDDSEEEKPGIDIKSDFEEEEAESFDMTEESETGEEDEEELSNEHILASYFSKLESKKIKVALNITQGRAIFQPLLNVQPGKMKKKDRIDFFDSKLQKIYGDDIALGQYVWRVNEQGNGWLISYDNDQSFIHLIDQSADIFNGKVLIREMMPDELIWTRLVTEHYELPEEQITVLASIQDKSSRLVFLKGSEIFHVIPVINEESKTRNILETIFSKLIFEMDQGTLPAIHKLIIMNSSGHGQETKDFFIDRFGEIEVDYFLPNPKKIVLSEKAIENPTLIQPYVTAIGAALAASEEDKKNWADLSFLPEYVKERQRVFKLKWHGMILLLLIALAPMVIDRWQKGYASESERLNNSLELMALRISKLQPVATEVEMLMDDMMILRVQNERLIDLSRNNYLWSETLNNLNNGFQQVPGTWISSLRVTGDMLSIEAHTTNRERIAQAAEVFDDARVLRIREGEVREATVLDFLINVHHYQKDTERFSPKAPIPDEGFIRNYMLQY